MTTTVTTQTDLDAAIAAGADDIVINSPAGVWLTLRGSSRVEAWGSSRVEAWGSSRVEARDSSRVEARDSSRVEAWDSSRVVAWGSSRVEARDSSRVVARDSSRVEARDSSRVVAWGSSRVVAWGSSRVEAWGSSRVEARDSSRVEARDSSRVEAGTYVAVHLWSQRVTLDGGVVIDMTTLDLDHREQWITYHGVKVAHGKAMLYKAVDSDLRAGQRHTLTAYPIGETVTAPDWQATASCGNGLHFGLSPRGAARYYNGDGEPRYLAVEVDAATLVPLDDKAKAPACRVLHEVDLHGDPIEAQGVTA